MFTGGTDTTAVTLQCSLAELINHPTIMEKQGRRLTLSLAKIEWFSLMCGLLVGDPKYWDDPLEFRPERFLSNDNESGKMGQLGVRGQHYQLLPFGSGRKGCPGASLALKVAHTTLATMIQCFELKAEEKGGYCGSVDMEEGPSFILSRVEPLICVPKSRFMQFPLYHAKY
ncbi:hypothetical protein JHK85_001331 [Glycine max]|nr:hypothetical protein JHK85_001330 [Glycine max]KAG5068954.1 hypothetical protein JHK85_001331 [Glycine max]KAG5088684.1 hypothetical protein JHK86_001296 [Glycine max]KAG5088685.1 hypothetical protein JHK86_001297 [Glycine max]